MRISGLQQKIAWQGLSFWEFGNSSKNVGTIGLDDLGVYGLGLATVPTLKQSATAILGDCYRGCWDEEGYPSWGSVALPLGTLQTWRN